MFTSQSCAEPPAHKLQLQLRGRPNDSYGSLEAAERRLQVLAGGCWVHSLQGFKA